MRYAHPNRVTGTSEMDTYTYDQNGNPVTRLVDGVSWTLAYNTENRLANVSDGNGASEGYLYDGDGVRVARVRPGVATYLFMGGLVEVTLALPSGTVTGSRSYYTVEGQVLAMSDGSSTSYLLTDHLGSVVGVVDGSGALVSEQRYLPFGEARTDLTGITATDLSFTGQRSLTGTGLLDYHARQYDPSLRSFIQADSIIPNPYGVQDYNRYLYVHANPVRFTDPSGIRMTECGQDNSDCGDELSYSERTRQIILQNLIKEKKYWDGLPPHKKYILEKGGWDKATYNEIINGDGVSTADIWHDPATYVLISVGIGSVARLAAANMITTTTMTSIWAAPSGGRALINGVNYSIHALERMLPVGLGGRGIPPSVVANAIKYGERLQGEYPNVVEITYENVMVILNTLTNTVITVIKIGR